MLESDAEIDVFLEKLKKENPQEYKDLQSCLKGCEIPTPTNLLLNTLKTRSLDYTSNWNIYK